MAKKRKTCPKLKRLERNEEICLKILKQHSIYLFQILFQKVYYLFLNFLTCLFNNKRQCSTYVLVSLREHCEIIKITMGTKYIFSIFKKTL
jgi:hypothetical protein